MLPAGVYPHWGGWDRQSFLHCLLSCEPVSGNLPPPRISASGLAVTQRGSALEHSTRLLLSDTEMDYEIQRCTRHCSVTERDLTPGEYFYSALVSDGAELVRLDYSIDAWGGPPQNVVGWWKSRMPAANEKRMRWAPNDVMLELFEQLQQQPDKLDMRYVLALLLVRRRVMRLEEKELDENGAEVLVLYCPRRETTYKVPEIAPEDSRIDQIQEELAQLLFADAA